MTMKITSEKYIITISNSEAVFSSRTESALSLGSKIAEQTGCRTALLVFGNGSHVMAGETAKRICSDVISVETEKNSLTPDAMTSFFSGIFSEICAGFIIFPETPEYSAIAPALAARLDSAWIQGVTGLYFRGKKPVFSRPVWGGRFLEDVTAESGTTVITTAQFTEKRTACTDNVIWNARFMDTPEYETRSTVEGWTYGARAEAGLKEAKVIFSAGQGMGGPENIYMLDTLADLVPGSAVGCSRPVCDQGWMEYRHQIGITGAVVAPKLYIACGISGSSQHVQGMQDSETVISINTDVNAPFLRNSDIGIIEDVKIFLPELARQISEQKS